MRMGFMSLPNFASLKENKYIPRRRSLREIGREVRLRITAAEELQALIHELLELALESADQPEPNPNRCLVEIPDISAVAHWSRDADIATIARCILGTLKYEPHAADTTVLRRALEGVIDASRQPGEEPKW
jgi:hypothetical protein